MIRDSYLQFTTTILLITLGLSNGLGLLKSSTTLGVFENGAIRQSNSPQEFIKGHSWVHL